MGHRWRLGLGLVALVACGRLGYGSSPDADGGPIDVTLPDPDAAHADSAPFSDAPPRDASSTATACPGSCACPAGGDCAFACTGGTSCALECGRNSICSLDCGGACGGCGIICLRGATCYLDCLGNGDPCSATGGNLTMTCLDTCGCNIQ